MATLIIGGRSFEIAPYAIGRLRRAAPHIDALNALAATGRAPEAGGVTGLLENTGHIVAILAIGLERVDPSLTAGALGCMIGPDDMAGLGFALGEILAESGLGPKEEGEGSISTDPAGGSLEEQLTDLVCRLVAAGVEGGSWDGIEGWSLTRADAMAAYWRRQGPPLHIAVNALANFVGITWEADVSPPALPDDAQPGQTIAELAATARPLL
ncbi:MAG: hypothetical protein JWR80_8102 [Bradyrhizobium sp.]|nr:hypothetical protein [Bradyrhizobium sp.]